jgi:undecaprenyl-diphosphatase
MAGDGSVRWLNPFDVQIERWLNHFAGHFPKFDRALLTFNSSNLTTSAVIVFLVWLAVFDAHRAGRLRERCEMIFGAAFFAMAGTLVTRAIAVSLPFRARPIATPALSFKQPVEGSMVLIHWSSFPSDHAALFFALAVGLLPVSRRIGWVAVSWVVAFIVFPLLYSGVHWPTDILAGAAIGISFVQLARVPSVRAFTRNKLEMFYQRRPDLLFALFFLWSYETTVLFDDVRRVLFFCARRFS